MRSFYFVASVVSLAACTLDSVDTSTTEDEIVTSSTIYDTDCTTEMRTVLDKARRFERAILGSRAYEQCVDAGMRNGVAIWGNAFTGPYRVVASDPFATSSLDWQIRKVLSITRATNDTKITCTGGAPGANAWSSIFNYDITEPEAMRFTTWLADVVAGPKTDTVPYAQLAGEISHEALHWHGYDHVWPAGSGNVLDNGIPYIVEGCIAGVLERSHAACGNADVCGGGDSVLLVDNYGSTSCTCTPSVASAGWRFSGAFTHVTSTGNSVGAYTELNDPRLNGHPEAVVQFMHVYAPYGTAGAYLGRGAYAQYEASVQRWRIYAARGAMPVGTGFFVRVGRGFIHEANGNNALNPYITKFDNIFSNGNWSAMLQVSAVGNGANPHPIGTYYDATTNRWSVFNQDLATIPAGTKFAISVENERNRALHYSHLVTTANRNAYGATMLTSSMLDGNPNARFLATVNGKRGPVWNPEEFGAWYDGYHWWIYSERDGVASSNLTLGTVFDIEILRDEIHRVVRVSESSASVDSGIDVQPKDLIHIQAVQQIQPAPGGSLVDPMGYPYTYSSASPIPSAPRGMLLGWLTGEGFFQIGEEKWRMGPTSSQRLFLRANDSFPGDGAGFFSAEVTVFR